MVSNRSGLTIIEQLAVLGLTTALIFILYPNVYLGVYERSRAKWQIKTCQSNMRQLSAAMLAYADDWHGRLPVWFLPDDRGQLDPTWDGARTWDKTLKPYLPGNKMDIIRCPGDRSGWFRHPTQGWVPARSYSYPGQLGGSWEPLRPDSKYVDQIPAPEYTVLLAEIVQSYTLQTWFGCAVMGNLGGTGDNLGDIDWGRHNGAANLAYVDGHVHAFTKGNLDLPGYKHDSTGRALCYYNDPLPRREALTSPQTRRLDTERH